MICSRSLISSADFRRSVLAHLLVVEAAGPRIVTNKVLAVYERGGTSLRSVSQNGLRKKRRSSSPTASWMGWRGTASTSSPRAPAEGFGKSVVGDANWQSGQ